MCWAVRVSTYPGGVQRDACSNPQVARWVCGQVFGRPNEVEVWAASNPVYGVVPGSKPPFLTSKFRPSGLAGGTNSLETVAALRPVQHTDILAHAWRMGSQPNSVRLFVIFVNHFKVLALGIYALFG